MEPDQVVQLGYPPARIDLLTTAAGVEFEACYERRVEVEIEGWSRPCSRRRGEGDMSVTDAPADTSRMYENLLDCVHCGLCLPFCPTFVELGTEMASPRGRVYLIRAVMDGRVPMTEKFIDNLYLCLGCRACETACPSGVKLGKLMEAAREYVETHRRRSLLQRAARHIVFRWFFSSQRNLMWMAGLLRLYQVTGLQRMVRALRMFALLPKALGRAEALMPNVPKRKLRRALPEGIPAEGKRRGRVAFFPGCIMNLMFGHVNQATVEVLTANGCEVIIPRHQRCCGALHVHSGAGGIARELARGNVDLFRDLDVESIVVNCAGCGGMLREYGDLLRDDPKYAEPARAFSGKVEDISECLDRIGIRGELREIRARVAYDDPCHLLHGQKVSEPPRSLLRRIPGLSLVSFPEADRCCGSAGIYNLTHHDFSMCLLDRKMANIAGARPDLLATGNPGCLLQLSLGVRRSGMNVEVVHLAELLARAQGI